MVPADDINTTADETRLLIVFTNYHSADLTIDCLRSIAPEREGVPGVRAMICENGSGPHEVAQLTQAIEKENWRDWVELRSVEVNRGFSGGNNVILREIMRSQNPPANVLLLNTDTLLRPGALSELMAAADAHPEAGIIGPRIEWPDGNPQVSRFRFKSPASELIDAAGTGVITKLLSRWDVPLAPCEAPETPPCLSFCCALIRREVLAQVGILDEGYYLYFDDFDYCRLAGEKGWGMLYWPAARVVHLHGQSNPVEALTKKRKRRPHYYYASRSRYFAKFYGTSGLWLTNFLWMMGRCVSLLREFVGNSERVACDKEWIDIWTNAGAPMKMPERALQRD